MYIYIYIIYTKNTYVLLSRFFLLHDNAPAHKAIFWPQNYYNPLSLPVLPRFISARLFPVPQVKNEFKKTLVAEFQKP